MDRRPPEEPREPAGDEPAEPRARIAALERRLAERERELEGAQREAARHRAFLEQASDAIFLLRPDGRVAEANQAGLDLIGVAEEEVEALALDDVVHPEDLARTPLDVASVMAGHVVRKQRRLVRRDGRAVLCETSTKRVGEGIQVIARDVSERERVTGQLLREAAHVRLLQDVAVAANEAPSFEDALHVCLQRVCRTTRWPVGHVYVRSDEDPERLVALGIWHFEGAERFEPFQRASEGFVFGPGEGLVGRVLAGGRAEWLIDASRDPGFARAEAAREAGLRGALAVPVLAGADVAAVLEFFSPNARPPDARMLDLVRHVGTQLGRLVERERAHRGLAELKERLELALRSAQFGVWSWSSRERLFRGDARTEELLGVRSPFSNEALRERLDAENAARLADLGLAELRAGTEFHEEFRVGASPERVVAVRGQVHRDARGELTRLTGLCWDVTESYRAQAALRLAHAENDRLLQTLPAALVALDPDERVLRWNDRAAALLRIPASAALGRPFFSIRLPLPAPPLREALGEARERGERVRLPEIEYRHPDGSGGFLEVTVNPVELEGAPAFLLVGTDITEIKALQEGTARARRLESIGQLAAGVAHEINTPLQFLGDNTRFLEKAVGELCDALERGPGAAADAELDFLRKECPRALEHTREGLEIVSRIVRSLKHLSHPGSGARGRLDLAAAVDDVLTLTRNEWKDVAEVETRIDPELGPLVGYPREIRQALLNLVVNAAHAVAERHAETGERGRIAIAAERTGERLALRVSDTGTGISEEDRPRVFDPFFTTKPPGHGTGQGLAIVHDAVVEKHGGAVRLDSEPGRGTTVHLEIPLEEGTAR